MFATETEGARRRLLPGGLFLVAVVEFFVAEYWAMAAAEGYFIRLHDISFLGLAECTDLVAPGDATVTMCSPLYALLNGGLMLLGVLQTAGVLLSWPAWRGGRLLRAGLGLLALAGLGAVGVGYWPADVSHRWHVWSSDLYFAGSVAGMALTGMALRARAPVYAGVTLAAAFVSLFGLTLYSLVIDWGMGRGFVERLGAYPILFWLIGTGVLMLLAWRGSRSAPSADH